MMRKIIAAVGAAFLLCFAFTANAAQAPIELSSDRFVKQDLGAVAQKQLLAQMNLLTGAGGKFKASVAYVGPGDVFSTSPYAGYSCARVFTAAQANTSTSLCDLNAVTGGAAVCTLRASSSGFVDLSAYCPGSLTPPAACAAASGGACNISQAYDLTGNTRHATQATNANRPGILFNSSPTGTLPVIDCSTGTNPVLATGVLTQAQPLAAAAVIIRTGGFTAVGGVLGSNSAGGYLIQGTTSTNQVAIAMPTVLAATASDSAWHAVNTLGNGASSAINVDGTDATGNASSSGLSAANLRLCRSGAAPYVGRIAKAWV